MKNKAEDTHYAVRLQDGSTADVCCGPMIVALGCATGYSVAPDALQCQRGDMQESAFLSYACPLQREEREKELEKNSEYPHPNSWDKGGTF